MLHAIDSGDPDTVLAAGGSLMAATVLGEPLTARLRALLKSPNRRLADGGGQRYGLGARRRFGDVIEYHPEFIATDARHDIRCTNLALQGARNVQQRGIAAQMAVSIVDRLQPVNIDEQHRGRSAMTLQMTDRT